MDEAFRKSSGSGVYKDSVSSQGEHIPRIGS